MFPETDCLSDVFSDTKTVLFRRRLVDRVLRIWGAQTHGEQFPRRDQIEPVLFGDDWVNCCIIAVRSPVTLSYLDAVGANLAYIHCPDDSLAGVLLARLSMVLSERRCLMIEGRATLRGLQVLYRSAMFPLSENGRILKENEQLIAPLIRTKWL
jgi:hypothetical protein